MAQSFTAPQRASSNESVRSVASADGSRNGKSPEQLHPINSYHSFSHVILNNNPTMGVTIGTASSRRRHKSHRAVVRKGTSWKEIISCNRSGRILVLAFMIGLVFCLLDIAYILNYVGNLQEDNNEQSPTTVVSTPVSLRGLVQKTLTQVKDKVRQQAHSAQHFIRHPTPLLKTLAFQHPKFIPDKLHKFISSHTDAGEEKSSSRQEGGLEEKDYDVDPEESDDDDSSSDQERRKEEQNFLESLSKDEEEQSKKDSDNDVNKRNEEFGENIVYNTAANESNKNSDRNFHFREQQHKPQQDNSDGINIEKVQSQEQVEHGNESVSRDFVENKNATKEHTELVESNDSNSAFHREIQNHVERYNNNNHYDNSTIIGNSKKRDFDFVVKHGVEIEDAGNAEEEQPILIDENTVLHGFPEDFGDGKEPILQLVKEAIGEQAFQQLDQETIDRLPTVAEVSKIYGSKPKVYGLETCQQFQTTEDLAEHFVSTAGTFNTGTNLMAELLIANCHMPARKKKYGTAGVRWQVLWGKHTPVNNETFRQTHHAYNDTSVQANNMFPGVMIRDPFKWMQSMCRHEYAAIWPRDEAEMDHCPNLIAVNNGTKENVPVTVQYKEFDYHHDSLVDFWNDWYTDYVKAPFPRLMIRFEDVIFHPKEITKLVCECAGGRLNNDAKRNNGQFIYVTDSAKKGAAHGTERTSYIDALVKYGTEKGRYTGYYQEDLQYAKENLDPTLMQLFGYQLPTEQDFEAVKNTEPMLQTALL